MIWIELVIVTNNKQVNKKLTLKAVAKQTAKSAPFHMLPSMDQSYTTLQKSDIRKNRQMKAETYIVLHMPLDK